MGNNFIKIEFYSKRNTIEVANLTISDIDKKFCILEVLIQIEQRQRLSIF